MDIEVKNSVKRVDYKESMKILEKRVQAVLTGKKPEFLWILEHNSIYTAGTNSKDNELLNKKLNVIKTNRGGKYTYHGPGQKIVYFVLNLNNREKDIRKLINKIENCIIQILKEYNVESHSDSKNIGIWVNSENKNKKIAAIGVRVKRWIAYHGFSLNISNNLSSYNGIIPCGIKNIKITSLKELGIKDSKNINKVITKKFLNIFR